jgi:penicillin-binding protein 1A
MKSRLLSFIPKGIIFLLFFLIAIETNFCFLFGYSPEYESIRNPNLSIASEVYDESGILLGKFYRENRVPVELDSVSPHFINALLYTEDAAFYRHVGIDAKSVVLSAFSTLKGKKRGGSTITQQLIKNLYKTRRGESEGLLYKIPVIRTLTAKLKEWINAVKVESIYTKDEILTLYINTVGFGNNTFGLNTASKYYFSKAPIDLSIEESALLVGMLKGTSYYNPLRYPERAIERRNVVLAILKNEKVIDASQCERLQKSPLNLIANADDINAEQESYVKLAIRKDIEDWCRENDIDLYGDGLKIYTTINAPLQNIAEQVVSDEMYKTQKRFYQYWGKQNPWLDDQKNEIPFYLINAFKQTKEYKNLSEHYGESDSILALASEPHRMKVFHHKLGTVDTTFSSLDSLRYYMTLLQTGVVFLEPKTGAVKCWVGGLNANYFKYDHVAQSKRQPGSTFKPFAYLTALLQGFTPCDEFVDQPVTIKYTENGETKIWSPKNADYRFTGWTMTMRWAMAKSCNSITAQITEKVGWKNVVENAHKMGINSTLDTVPSICLGTSDVNLLELVSSYLPFTNGGYRIKPQLVTRIEDRYGNVLASFETEQEQVLTEETSFLMNYMLRGGIQEPQGTSQALWAYDVFKKGNEIGGKTGTSNEYVDGWYVGITPTIVGGVWVGCEDRNIHFRTSLLGEGSKTALPVFARILEEAYRNPKTNIVEAKFEKPTEKIKMNYYCPVPYSVLDSLMPDTTKVDSSKSIIKGLANLKLIL